MSDNYRKLPFLPINTIDINTTFAQLFTQSNISTERRSWGLFAFADPMIGFYQLRDGIVMSFSDEVRECICSSFPLKIKCLPLPPLSPFLLANLYCSCACIAALVHTIEVSKIQKNEKKRYSFRVTSKDSPPVVREMIQKGYQKLLSQGKFKLDEELINKIDDLRIKLETHLNRKTMLRLKDRLLFDNTFIVGQIKKEYKTQDGASITTYKLRGGVVLSLYADKDEFKERRSRK